jgi:hypothetical protein
MSKFRTIAAPNPRIVVKVNMGLANMNMRRECAGQVRRVIMKTMHEILRAAPPAQITRCKIAMVEMAHSYWAAAASTIENAINESEPGEWTRDCMQMRDFCMAMDKVKSEGIRGVEHPGKPGISRVLVETAARFTLLQR